MRLSIIFAVVWIAMFIFFGYLHEVIHQQIFERDGIKARIDLIHYFPDFVVIPEEGCKSEVCVLSNSLNEVVSYPLGIFYLVFGAGMLIIICIFEDLWLMKLQGRENEMKAKR